MSTKKVKLEPGFIIDPRNGNILFQKQIDGKTVKFSCKTDNFLTAKRFANKELKRRLNVKKVNVTPLMGFWITKYRDYRLGLRESGLSNSAIKNSRVAMDQVYPFFKAFHPNEVNRDTWVEFCSWYKKNYESQLDNVTKYFGHFLKWLLEERHNGKPVITFVPTITNPDAKKNRKARKKKKDRVLTEAEFRSIYRVADDEERLLILLMYTMAFRVESDALSARWDQFKLDQNPPIYTFGEFDNKAGLEGSQAINSLVLPLLKERKMNSKSPYVFPQKTNPLKFKSRAMINWDALRQKSKLTWHWTPHVFRHSCLTRLAEKNLPTHLICKCFRISYQEFVETYAHVTREGLEIMQDAIEVKL